MELSTKSSAFISSTSYKYTLLIRICHQQSSCFGNDKIIEYNFVESFPCKILLALMKAFNLLSQHQDGGLVLPLLVDLVDHFIELLDIRLPLSIQKEARDLLIILGNLDEDYVWFRCMEHLPKGHSLLPTSKFHEPFPFFHPDGDRFTENVECVLKALESNPEQNLRGYTYRPGMKVR